MRFSPGEFTAAGGSVRVLPLPPTFALVLPLLRQFRFAALVDQHCPIRSDALMTHGQVAEAMVLQMLQDSRRVPLYKLAEWSERHNLHALYEIEPDSFEDRRVGSALDALAPVAQEVHVELVNRILAQCDLPVRAVLWDLTHVSFEGSYERSELVEAGYGHGRIHDKQLKVSMHADANSALPLMYRVLPGATNQTPLAEGFLGELQQRLRRTDLIVVSDKAGLSYDNIVAYRAHQGHFIGPLQTTPAEQALIDSVAAEDFKPLAYRSQSKPHEQFLYCPKTVVFKRQKHRQPLHVDGLVIYSTQKHEDDRKRRHKALEKTLAKLEQVCGYLNKGRYVSAAYAREQLDRKISGEAQGLIGYELSGQDKQLSLRYWVDEAALAAAQRVDGRYLIVHNVKGTPDEIFALYKAQHRVENCFRSFNSHLQVKPLWLHKDERIEALLFLWMIALTIFTLLGILAQRAGLDNEPYYYRLTPRAMLELFDQAHLVEITLKGKRPEYQLHLKDRMLEILEALGLHNPQRLLTY